MNFVNSSGKGRRQKDFTDELNRINILFNKYLIIFWGMM